MGKEFPIFEFENNETSVENKVERELLSSHFNVVWENYSIDVLEYGELNMQEIFESNLRNLIDELNCGPQKQKK